MVDIVDLEKQYFIRCLDRIEQTSIPDVLFGVGGMKFDYRDEVTATRKLLGGCLKVTRQDGFIHIHAKDATGRCIQRKLSAYPLLIMLRGKKSVKITRSQMELDAEVLQKLEELFSILYSSVIKGEILQPLARIMWSGQLWHHPYIYRIVYQREDNCIEPIGCYKHYPGEEYQFNCFGAGEHTQTPDFWEEPSETYYFGEILEPSRMKDHYLAKSKKLDLVALVDFFTGHRVPLKEIVHYRAEQERNKQQR